MISQMAQDTEKGHAQDTENGPISHGPYMSSSPMYMPFFFFFIVTCTNFLTCTDQNILQTDQKRCQMKPYT